MSASEGDDTGTSASVSASDSDDDGTSSSEEYDDGILAATLPDLALLQVFEYVAAENLDDLVSAGQVCRHWRRVAASDELWRQRRLKSHGMPTQAFTRVVAFAPRLLALDVCWINQISPEDRVIRKQALLGTHCRLRRLTGVTCHRDAEWTQTLLALQAAHLRELEVGTADRDTLRAIGGMRQLRTLRVSGWDPGLKEDPVVFQDSRDSGGLECLEVRGLPRDTTMSLLRCHRKTLRKLTLNVGTASSQDKDPGWPWACHNLPQVLEACGFAKLQEIILTRYVGCCHTEPDCMQQRKALEHHLRLNCSQCSECSPYNLIM